MAVNPRVWAQHTGRYRLRVGVSQAGRRHLQQVRLQLVAPQQRSGLLQREGKLAENGQLLQDRGFHAMLKAAVG